MISYEKKLKRFFILFLGTFSLVLCLITFFIISASLERQYTNLSQNHMEHRQQNFEQKFSVFSQNIILFATDTQLISNIQNNFSDQTYDKIQNFQQSTGVITSFAVFQSNGDTPVFFVGNKNIVSAENFWKDISKTEISSGWYFFPDEKNPFLYLCPVQNEQTVIGYLLFRINSASFMSSFYKTNDSSLWTEHTAIFSDRLIWCDDPAYWNVIDSAILSQASDFFKRGNLTLSSSAFLDSGEQFVQLLEKNTWKLYRPLILSLSLFFLGSLVMIRFTINRHIHKIISRLQNLQKKMSLLKK